MEIGETILPKFLSEGEKGLSLDLLKVMFDAKVVNHWIHPVMEECWLKEAIKQQEQAISELCGFEAAQIALKRIRTLVDEGTYLFDFIERIEADPSYNSRQQYAELMDETYHVFVRKRNDGIITRAEFNQVIQRFEGGFIQRADVEKVNPTQSQKIASRSLIELHSINSTDAYILQCALDEANKLRTAGDDLILVSSDRRPLTAAKKERLSTFDPENDNQIDLDFLINS